jgi:hypothetical protein
VYAAITTLTFDPASPVARDIPALLRNLVGRTCPAALAAGMLDATLLHLPPDRVVMIAIYETEGEAISIASTVEQAITTEFPGRLTWQHRVVGRLLHSVLPDESELLWRSNAQTLHAIWATWRVGPHLRSDEALERFVAWGRERFDSLLRQLGQLDALVIRYGEDSMAVLNLYAEPVEGQAGYRQMVAKVADFATGNLDLVEARTGEAYDLAMLLARTV